MKIVSLISQLEYTPEQLAKFESIGELHNHSVNKISGDEIVELVKDADYLIVGSSGVTEIDRYVLEKCLNLKFISVLGVSVDFIDIEAATELGVKVSKLKGSNADSVAEHLWGMILGLSKRITESHNGTKDGQYQFLHYPGIELNGKTLGVLGLGEIGVRVARMAQGFEMKVIAHTRTPKELPGVENVELSELLERADVVAVCLPLTSETEGLIGSDAIAKMRQNAILVSIAKEQVVDPDAVLDALESKKLFGYGYELDISTPADERFYNHPNVLITPHTAFFTPESEQKSNDMGVDNMVAFAEGKPTNLVN